MSKYKIANYGFRNGSLKTTKDKSKKNNKKNNYRGNDGFSDIREDFFRLYSDFRDYCSRKFCKSNYSKKETIKNKKGLQFGLIALAGFIVISSVISFPVAICLCLIAVAIYLNK